MSIRPANTNDIPAILAIYAYARDFMAQTGNPTQWIDGYPSPDILSKDLKRQSSYVCENEAGRVIGTFCFRVGIEPNYLRIDEGKWLNDSPYGVIHRLASDGTQKGFADYCIDWCFSRYPNLRVDTHRENKIMQHILRRNGFVECGTIWVENGTSRIAFQKTR